MVYDHLHIYTYIQLFIDLFIFNIQFFNFLSLYFINFFSLEIVNSFCYLSRIQSLQSKILRKIAGAPFYVSSLTLHNDLHVPFVKDLARSRYQKFHSLLNCHPNSLAQHLSSPTLPDNPTRRLRRQWPRDLL